MTHQTNFSTPWQEILYIYDQILDSWYGKGLRRKAQPYAPRLEALLRQVATDSPSIKEEECWSILCELKDDIPRAIEHREREIELMHLLLSIPSAVPISTIDYSDVHDRLILLALLFIKDDRPEQARSSLLEAKRLAEEHGFAFEGMDLLDEVQEP